MTSAHIHAPVRINLIGFDSLKPKTTRRKATKSVTNPIPTFVEASPLQPLQSEPQKSTILSLLAEEEMQASAPKIQSSHLIEEPCQPESTSFVKEDDDEDDSEINSATAIRYEDDPVFQVQPEDGPIFDPADD